MEFAYPVAHHYSHNPYAVYGGYCTGQHYLPQPQQPVFRPGTSYVPPCRTRCPDVPNYSAKPLGQRRKPQGRRGDPPSVCLDYLKGVCNDKRYKCKFAHPPMPLVTEAKTLSTTSKQEVCDVWVLTGFCKFGDKCRFFHPQLDDGSVTCAPAITAKMSRKKKGKKTQKEEIKTFSSEGDSSDDSSPQPSETSPPTSPTNCDINATVKRVNGILNKITPEKFGLLADQLMSLVTGDSDLLLRVLPLVFAKGCTESQLGEVYAKLCRHLYCTLVPANQNSMASTLIQLGYRLLRVDDVVAQLDDEQLAKLNFKRLGNVRFLGQLFLADLIPAEQLSDVIALLVDRLTSHKDMIFHAELLCKLLSTVGKRLDEIQFDISGALRALQLVPEDETRVRVLVQNLIDMRTDGWLPRREEEKARTLAEMEAAARLH